MKYNGGTEIPDWHILRVDILVAVVIAWREVCPWSLLPVVQASWSEEWSHIYKKQDVNKDTLAAAQRLIESKRDLLVRRKFIVQLRTGKVALSPAIELNY